jgi:hypothetical protein
VADRRRPQPGHRAARARRWQVENDPERGGRHDRARTAALAEPRRGMNAVLTPHRTRRAPTHHEPALPPAVNEIQACHSRGRLSETGQSALEPHSCCPIRASAVAVPALTLAPDENQASASARSARASLLHRWEDGSDAVAIGFHVAFPADAEPAEVAQPGNVRSTTQRTRPGPESWSVQRRAITGSRLGATGRDGTCRGDSSDRRSLSENGDALPSAGGNRRAAPPRPAVRIAMATNEKADDPRHLP